MLLSGSIDQQLLSQILDELNRTNFQFEKSEDFRSFVENPVELDQAYLNPVDLDQDLDHQVLVSSSSLTSLLDYFSFLHILVSVFAIAIF